VALGLVVDDSIVVVENIERWLRRGLKPLDASIVATKQIGLAVLGFTATLVIAFLPLVFLPEGSGEFIRGLPMAVICSVIASMLVSLTITPFLSSRLLKEHVEGYEGNWFLRILQKLISGSYSRLLEWSLRRPVVTLIIVSVIFVGSLSLIPVLGFSLFPSSEKPQFFINVNPEQQSSLTATNNIVKGVEAILDTMNEVQYYATNVGKGNPQIYYNEIQQNEKNDFAQIFVQLNAEIKAEEKLLIIEKLRKRFASLPDARIEVRNFEQGPPVVAPIEVRLKGNNLDTLRMLAERVEEKLKRTPGTLYVESPITILKSDLRVKIDIPKARLYNLNSVDIDMNVRMAIAGLEAGSFTDPVTNDEVKILLTLPRGENATIEVFDKLYINNQTGQSIPLRQVATPVLETSFLSINHFDKVRTVGITAYVQKDAPKSDVIGQVVKDMKTFSLPKGYTYQMGGEVESASRSFAGFGTIILLTVFLFTAVLILEFDTFKSTLIVLSVIPLGMVGALLALWMSGDTLSFVAVIGIIALAGIEVKNSILLVDFTNQLREQGYTLHDAIREAGEQRFLPIILTSLTAIGGLTPIVLSGNPLISPLAVVIIGGLVSSTILSRIVTPVVYMLIPPHVEVKSQEQLY
jgi:multidrug efflux pump subunit AcrB